MDVLELFRRPPRPVCHHALSVFHGEGPEDIFRTLMHILKCGLSVLFGVGGEVHVDRLGDVELNLLSSYFMSFCVRLKIDHVHADTRPSRGSSLADFSSVCRTPTDAFRVSCDFSPLR